MKLFCTGLLFVLGLPAIVFADESAASKKPVDTPSLWVSSMAPIGGGQYAAGIADGLLLRPSKVVQIGEDAIGDVAKQVASKTLYEHDAAVWCLAATSDQKQIASLDYRGNLGTMNVATGETQMHAKAGERWCQCLAASPDDSAWVFGNEAGKLMVWSIGDAKQTQSMDVGDEALTSLSFSPSGNLLAVGSGAGQVRVVSWPELKEQAKLAIGEGPVWSVLFYGDDSIIVGSNDRRAYSVNVDGSGKLSDPTVLLKAGDWVTKLIPSGSDVYAGEVSGVVHRLRLGGSDRMTASSGVWALAVGTDGSVIAGTRRDGVTSLTAIAEPVEVKKEADEEAATEPAKEEPAKEESPAKETAAKPAAKEDSPAPEPKSEPASPPADKSNKNGGKDK